MEEVRARALVAGRVQGVFFRHSAAAQARAAGVRGWIRNLPDGRVEAELQGTGPAVEEMLRWCAQGPPGARVESVSVEWLPPDPGAGSFSVR